MKTIDFTDVNVRIAENQEEYETLPAYYNNEDGSIVYGFKLGSDEVAKVVQTGEIWLKQLTFGKAMQPIFIAFAKGEVLQLTKEDKESEQFIFPHDLGDPTKDHLK